MQRKILHTDGLERAVADVQRYLGDRNPFGFNLFQYFRGEMEPGGRGGNGAALPRKNGLISLAVGIYRVLLALDIRRQRGAADLVKDAVEIAVRLKPDPYLSVFRFIDNLGGQLFAEN